MSASVINFGSELNLSFRNMPTRLRKSHSVVTSLFVFVFFTFRSVVSRALIRHLQCHIRLPSYSELDQSSFRVSYSLSFVKGTCKLGWARSQLSSRAIKFLSIYFPFVLFPYSSVCFLLVAELMKLSHEFCGYVRIRVSTLLRFSTAVCNVTLDESRYYVACFSRSRLLFSRRAS